MKFRPRATWAPCGSRFRAERRWVRGGDGGPGTEADLDLHDSSGWEDSVKNQEAVAK